MSEHILFLTGRLAEASLARVLAELPDPAFTYRVHTLPLKVAGLMTTDMVCRRLPETFGADRIVLPGRCRGELAVVERRFGVAVERGPDDLKDLPEYFGGVRVAPDLARYRVRMFAEIVDAPEVSPEAVLGRARQYRDWGADVIDLGCLPGTPFPHLERCIDLLKSDGMAVSVDSLDETELLRGGRAGADYLLSLTETSLELLEHVDSIPILIPAEHGDLDSLERAVQRVASTGRPFLIDPILDPIHFGFTESLVRYRDARARFPDAGMLMGIGNLTELTDADTGGMNTLLLGIASELAIDNVLTTQVSEHARSALREVDLGRRMMLAAAETQSLPRGISRELLQLHERAPFPYDTEEIKAFAAAVRDPSYRVQVSEDGIHVYNRDGLQSGADPFALYPQLRVETDASHAFYLGVELARAEIAWQLGKRYVQDEPLRWGRAVASGTGPGTDGEPTTPGREGT